MKYPNQVACPVCARMVAVRASGRIYRHGGTRRSFPALGHCRGSGASVAPIPTSDMEQAWEDLQCLVRARQILRVRGATVDTVYFRGVARAHLGNVIERLREICRPRLTP